MAASSPLETDRPAPRPDRRPLAALGVGVAAAAATLLVWRFFVTTRTGQTLDHAAITGAEHGQGRLLLVAEPVLSVISVPFIAVVLLAAMLLAVVRRRVLLAVQVALLVGGANLTTQVLKRWLLDRPDLDVGYRLENALPSGHTTAAASVSAALLFVMPRRWRPLAAVVGVLYTTATGVSTLVGQWHRPSDVVAAVLVVLAWAAFVAALGSPSPGPSAGYTPVAVALLVAAGLGAVVAGLALRAGLDAVDGGLATRTEVLTAYLGGAAGIAAVTCLAFGVLLLLRRPPAQADDGGPVVRRPRTVDAAS